VTQERSGAAESEKRGGGVLAAVRCRCGDLRRGACCLRGEVKSSCARAEIPSARWWCC